MDGVRDNVEGSRFELLERDTVVGFLDYDRTDGRLTLTHTEITPSRRGEGLGDQLVAGALEAVRDYGSRVTSRCWFVTDFLERHPDYADLAV